ncbi:hypothetical protein IMZ11_35600 [Microtetraspora sp. AC03309]|uniref:hypothetical protein n=1 Tax=Microtetraspora sp. AC03309 TaxID=2779376 RepID=UPI001E2BC00A|nr:hypothetical protein [Microtetraspora sp. AC03309]MCC5580953.1 hypothetical protein [Microtetraspora sp. AC03309]
MSVRVILMLMGGLILFVVVNPDADGLWALMLFGFLVFLLAVVTSDYPPTGRGGGDGGAGYDGGGRGGDGGFGGDGGDGGD